MALRQDRNFWRATVLVVGLFASLSLASAEESALLAPGVSAYQAGKTDQAIKALSAVLTNSGASGTDHARAYFYRGLAYEKSGKPAQAIADLNNALWLKGLSDGERADALLARGKAYKATGLETRAAQDFRDAERLAPGAASAELAAVAPSETEAPAAAVELQNNNGAEAAASQSSGSTALVLSPSTVQTTAKPKKSSEAISTATVGGETAASSQSTGTSSTLNERSGTITRTSSSEALSTATVPSNSGSISSIFSGGDFFSDLFSSSPSAEPAVTESTSAPAAEAPQPQRQVIRARGETVEIGSSGGSAETAVASAAPVATSADVPLDLAPATAEPQASDPSFTAETETAEPQLSSWSSTTETDEQQTSFTATTELAAPAAARGNDAGSDPGTTVVSFFENLFSSNEPTDSTGSAASAPPQPVQPEVQVASLEPQVPATAEPVAEAPTGRYRAQVATVRTPEEAEIIALRMRTERQALLGNRQASVEPVVLGNMGTFYAVMIGPFASERQSEKFCGRLQNEGIDCFVAEP